MSVRYAVLPKIYYFDIWFYIASTQRKTTPDIKGIVGRTDYPLYPLTLMFYMLSGCTRCARVTTNDNVSAQAINVLKNQKQDYQKKQVNITRIVCTYVFRHLPCRN